jgi:hypothetical protein
MRRALTVEAELESAALQARRSEQWSWFVSDMFSFQKFPRFPSRQMFGHMYGALNIDEKNQLYSLEENHEINLLA